MLRFIFKRIVTAIPLLFCVALLSFLLIQIAPGDYFDSLKANPQISAHIIDQYKQEYALDQPIYLQFFYWLRNFVHGDFGYSFSLQAPVLDVIGYYAGNTLLLAGSSLLVTWIGALYLGTLSAIKRNSKIDRTISIASLVCISFPSFIVAIFLVYIASYIPGMPIGNMKSIDYENFSIFGKIIDVVKHLIVPTLAISLLGMASLIRIVRANMLETLKQPYILSARARGLNKTVIVRQAFINSLNPLITILGYEFSMLLSGAAIIEIICAWPGLGSVMLSAVMKQDLFLVMGGIIIGSVMLIIGNILADIMLVALDPRIKMK